MVDPVRSAPTPRLLYVVGGMAILYLVWGTTYLAIRLQVASLPVFLSSGLRWVLPGLFFLALERSSGRSIQLPRKLQLAMVVTGLCYFGGNGLLSWAELAVPSGMAALFIGLVPLWFYLWEWTDRGAAHLAPLGLVGILLGLVGVFLLVAPQTGLLPGVALQGARPDGAALIPGGVLGAQVLLLLAALGWGSGAYHSGRVSRAHRLEPLTVAGYQMLWGGLVLMACGLALGERPADFLLATASSWWAWVFLLFVASGLTFFVFTWLVTHVALTKVGTYAYVNPVIAVLLGAWVGGEGFDRWVLSGMAVVLIAIALVRLAKYRSTPSAGNMVAAADT